MRGELLNNGGLNAPKEGMGRTHVWSAVPHSQGGEVCRFCNRVGEGGDPDELHHVWFVALITQIRFASHAREASDIIWSATPKWVSPLCVYKSYPLSQGPPADTWPEPSADSRSLLSRGAVVGTTQELRGAQPREQDQVP